VNMLVNQGLLPTPAIKELIFLEFPYRIHGTEIFTYSYHTFKPNVGRYTYHSSGSYEIYLGPKSWKNLCIFSTKKQAIGSAERFDPSSQKWSRLPNMLSG